VAWGHVEAGRDQLPGANLNYPTVRRWADVSNAEYGVTWISPDAPLMELTQISADPIAFGWLDEVKPSSHLFSYVMNNYWETNFLAAQEGPHMFRYSLISHPGFNAAQSEKAAREITQPLLSMAGRVRGKEWPFVFNCKDVIVDGISVIAPSTYLLRLFNTGDEAESLVCQTRHKQCQIFHSDSQGNVIKSLIRWPRVQPNEVIYLRIKDQ
jgi:hypothetical protein